MSISVTTEQLPSSRRRDSAPLSPSAVPDLALLPAPLASNALPVGQLVSKAAKLDPTTLEERDYDDVGTRWYKDVIKVATSDGRFIASLGGVLLVQYPEDGTEVGTIEAPHQRVRLLKDADAALQKVVSSDETKAWLKEQAQKGDVGFVVATREVTNASYKRAKLVDVGNNNWEVHREVGSENKSTGKRRPSGLEVDTGSKTDVVGVVVRKVVVEGDEVKLGAEIAAEFWN
ncbi:hypothetical protein K504DRAFT_508495 [Pleomassaria siparia CBS 279.74]|uniref:Uncharacterized protein n=1 Tax=Pleomassaria siparia CBS 279.74 TaxID=1314801 RepID=A0A6G1JSE7_9PLEO|nr:hypothetical protein K504DRAFT_508495 [Pleomassaria siparia CBS 279.74]